MIDGTYTDTIEIEKFETIAARSGSSALVDLKNKIVKIEWHGIVDLGTASEILNHGAGLIEKGHCNKLLLNRKNLVEFTADARLWIKQDLLIKRAQKLVSRVERVATVNPSSTMGNVFANFLTTGIKIVFPNLRISKFDSEEAAIDWLG